MERLKLEKVYVNIRKEDKPNFFFCFWCINMVAVLLFWDTNMAAVIMQKRKLKIRKLIVIIMIMVIIIIIIFTWILARKSCIFNYNNENNDHKKKKKKNSYLKSISLKMIRWFWWVRLPHREPRWWMLNLC